MPPAVAMLSCLRLDLGAGLPCRAVLLHGLPCILSGGKTLKLDHQEVVGSTSAGYSPMPWTLAAP